MNHTQQNSLRGCAYMLGITAQELIDVLHNASKVKEIRTASGCPFVLPARESTEESTPEIRFTDNQRRRVDTDGFTPPDFTNADECQRAVTRLTASLGYWQIEADYWHGMWLNNLQR